MKTSPLKQLIRRSEMKVRGPGQCRSPLPCGRRGSLGLVSLLEHWSPASTLAAPLHRHSREDEFSLVLSGSMVAQLGDEIVTAEVGDLVLKPRGQWHTFWNAAATECRFLEIISPGGFEEIFKDMYNDPESMTGDAAAALDARYGIEADYDSIARLCAEHRLVFPA